MNEIVKSNPAHEVGAVRQLAKRYAMEANDFAITLRETVFQKATDAQFVALAVVANEYRLNPLTKEIYAFPAKGGGIVPIVSIDGWVRLINERPELDGFDFEYKEDSEGKLVSCTCTMWRKDRTKPIVITEFLSECKRDTVPWEMERRMLRHKTLIQTARYAFGFSGIYEPDEAERIQAIGGSVIEGSTEPPIPPSPEQQDSFDNAPSVKSEEVSETIEGAVAGQVEKTDTTNSSEGSTPPENSEATTSAVRSKPEVAAEVGHPKKEESPAPPEPVDVKSQPSEKAAEKPVTPEILAMTDEKPVTPEILAMTDEERIKIVALGLSGAIGPDEVIFNQQARYFGDHFRACSDAGQAKIGAVKKELFKLCGDKPDKREDVLKYVEGVTGVTVAEFEKAIP